MQPMWCYAGNQVDLDDTNWRISAVDTNAKDSLNPEALQIRPVQYNQLQPLPSMCYPGRSDGQAPVTSAPATGQCLCQPALRSLPVPPTANADCTS